MTVTCAECWRLYEPTPDDIRRHQMVELHRPVPLDKGDARVVAAAAAKSSRRNR